MSRKSPVKRPYLIAVDPGLNGAMAVLDRSTLALKSIYDLPTYQTPTKSRKSGYFLHLDVHKFANLVGRYAKDTEFCVIEDVGAMPDQGLSSTFRFGKVAGLLHGAMAAFFLPVIPVSPAVWKLSLGLTSDKAKSLELAKKKFPESAEYFKLQKHNDRAEAALMAYFGAKNIKI